MSNADTYFLFVHGNPGHEGDFNALISELGIPRANVITPSLLHEKNPIARAKEIVLAKIPSSARLVAFGYSWGAWLICKLMEDENFRNKVRFKQAFLCSPYVIPQNNMSALAKMLMSIPGIKNVLAKKIAQKKFNTYLQEILVNDKNSENVRESNRIFLLDPSTWLSAIHLKLTQERNPVQKNILVPITVFTAKDDKAMDPALQSGFLKQKAAHFTMEVLQDGNHGLIWTRTATIAEKIKNILQHASHDTH